MRGRADNDAMYGKTAQLHKAPNSKLPLKRQVSCSLKSQPAGIALRKHSIFRSRNMKLHAVSAFHLKCHIICGVCCCMEPMRPACIAAVCLVMVRNIRSFGNNSGGHGQSGGMIVFVPFSNSLYESKNNDAEYKNKHEGEYNVYDSKHFLLIPFKVKISGSPNLKQRISFRKRIHNIVSPKVIKNSAAAANRASIKSTL